MAEQHRDRGKLSGRIGRALARDLALGELNQSALAEKYGVVPSSITEFKQRRAEEIAAIAAHADDEYAGMWIAKKVERLAELERIFDKAMTPTPKISPKGTTVSHYDPETGESHTIMEIDGRAAMQALKQAAEELGQLATRVQLAGGLDVRTNYTVEGVDPKDLR